MNIEEVREFALSLPYATEDQPFGDDIVTYRIGGKIFMCLWLGGGRHDMKFSESRIALKLDPDRNIELRDSYGGITPAWHWNKKHWSDVYYTRLDCDFCEKLITEAYRLVREALPKKKKDGLLEDNNFHV